MDTKELTIKTYTKMYIDQRVASQLYQLSLGTFEDYLELAHKARGFRQCMRLNDISYAEIEACENYEVEIQKP